MNNEEIVVSVKNLTKYFAVSENKNTTIKHFLFNIFNKTEKNLFYALKNINLEVKKGEIVGFIGRNGSGKSTLTKIINGIYPPSKGEVRTKGNVLLMSLGLGVSQELTVKENIYLTSSMLGNRINETDMFLDELLEFSELTNFIDRKIKYLSSGMQSRLSFSVALYAKADIIILDEIFAVGDNRFMSKATKALEEKILKNSTIIMVSHDNSVIRRYCSRVLYLKNGEACFYGDTETAVKKYEESID